MKITKEHFEELKTLLSKNYKGKEVELNAYKKELEANPKVLDVDRRFIFDLLYQMPYEERGVLVDKLYVYLNDNHLHTAVSRAVKDLNLLGE